MRRRLFRLAALLALLVAVSCVYLPGLHGPFVLDDGENITLNPAVAMTSLDAGSIRAALTSNESGPLKRPLPVLSFALNHYAAGSFDSTFVFKVTNLVIHLINTVLIWILTMMLLATPAGESVVNAEKRFVVALFVAALWALHPIQLTNVLYVVQRMNSMAALWVIAGLILYIHGRSQLHNRPRGALALMSVGSAIGLVLGSLSKENAVLWPLFALTIEFTLMQPDRLPKPSGRRLVTFYVAVFAILAVIGTMLLYFQPELLRQGYTGRAFSPFQRVLTETRVLWFYVVSILIPNVHDFGLFHDDIALSTTLLDPITTLPAIAGVAAILTFAVVQRKRYPVFAFSVLWFLVGHSLESGAFGLELVYEHRNYLPSYGLLFGVVVLVVYVSEKHRRLNCAAYALLATLVVLFAAVTLSWATAWKDGQTLASRLIQHHPESPRANDFAARLALDEHSDVVGAMRYTLRGMAVAPRETGFHLDLRILLALIARQMEQQPKTVTSIDTHGTTLKVPGVDTEFRMTRYGKNIRVTYPASESHLPTLLANEPISAHTIFSMENLRHCITDPPSVCEPLYDEAVKWFAIAAENANASRDYRAILAADTAILFAYRGNYQSAYHYMDRAAQLLPNMPLYRTSRIDYLIHLCRLGDAQKLLTDVPVTDPHADRLHEMYAAAEQKKNCHTTSPQK